VGAKVQEGVVGERLKEGVEKAGTELVVEGMRLVEEVWEEGMETGLLVGVGEGVGVMYPAKGATVL
jgi:hypothetical protein